MPAAATAEPVTSQLTDLRDVPLGAVAARADLSAVLGRVLPDLPVQVPVAAFNSSV